MVLGQLAALDWRVGALIRLVKAWARQQGINNAGEGTLSSHALSLMVGGRPQLQMACHRNGRVARHARDLCQRCPQYGGSILC